MCCCTKNPCKVVCLEVCHATALPLLSERASDFFSVKFSTVEDGNLPKDLKRRPCDMVVVSGVILYRSHISCWYSNYVVQKTCSIWNHVVHSIFKKISKKKSM